MKSWILATLMLACSASQLLACTASANCSGCGEGITLSCSCTIGGSTTDCNCDDGSCLNCGSCCRTQGSVGRSCVTLKCSGSSCLNGPGSEDILFKSPGQTVSTIEFRLAGGRAVPLHVHSYAPISVESAAYEDTLRLRIRNKGTAALTRVVWGWEFQFRSGAIRFAVREDGWAFPDGATVPGLLREREWQLTISGKEAPVAAKAVVLYAEFEDGSSVGASRDRIREYYSAADAKITALFRELGGAAGQGDNAVRGVLARAASSPDGALRAHARHLQMLLTRDGAGSVARHTQWFMTFRNRL